MFAFASQPDTLGAPRTVGDVIVSAEKLKPKTYDEIRQRVEEERKKAAGGGGPAPSVAVRMKTRK